MSPASASPAAPRAVLAAAILASSLGFIDGSVLPVAIPAIRVDLGADFTQVQWLSNGYMLLLSALILVGGAAGDLFGQRETYAGGILVFCLASVGCALAGSAGDLLAWRAAQGAGAAFMVPGSLALIARTFPSATRGRAIGLWSMASGVAAALGPILGGYLIDAGGPPAWRWIFWINLPVGLATLALLYGWTPRLPARAGGRLDLVGAALVTVGLGGLALGLTYASEPAPPIARIAACFALGVLALAVFWVWEGQVPSPMLPRQLFRLRVFNGANLLTFFLYFALAGTLFFLPITLIEALGLPEAQAGSVFLPFTVAMALMSRYAGGLSDRIGPRLPLTLGSAVTGLSFLALAAAIGARAFLPGVVPAMVLMGIGMGLVVTPLSTTVMTAADDALAGTASGVNNGVARIAGLFAVAGLGVVASLAYRLDIDPALVSGGYGEPLALQSEAARLMRADALIAAFIAVSGVTAVLSFVSAAISWALLPGKQGQPQK
ncbi:MFS transporter [Labrys monachus]|uniref:EmrB/QacA subfamily drug resistance transporter n=1 Tax=Labrys monachus TaxID=217067 RepID=A0ABU0FJF9_9HYPH|nr:MFS transporter [Labrys monachus]MDQ0394744.1 EmrB/QacA subfamily drug resistance transporter [Labrys monachus]